jgi:hypothetical protein
MELNLAATLTNVVLSLIFALLGFVLLFVGCADADGPQQAGLRGWERRCGRPGRLVRAGPGDHRRYGDQLTHQIRVRHSLRTRRPTEDGISPRRRPNASAMSVIQTPSPSSVASDSPASVK